MSKFTAIILTIFVLLTFTVAIILARDGAYGPAGTALGMGLAFSLVGRMAVFEKRLGIAKREHGAGLAAIPAQLKLYWNSPGWEGRIHLGFGCIVAVAWVVQRIAILISIVRT